MDYCQCGRSEDLSVLQEHMACRRCSLRGAFPPAISEISESKDGAGQTYKGDVDMCKGDQVNTRAATRPRQRLKREQPPQECTLTGDGAADAALLFEAVRPPPKL